MRGCLSEEARNLLVRKLPEIAGEVDESNRIPREFLDDLKGAGLLGDLSLECLYEAVRLAARTSPGASHVILVHGSSSLLAGYRGGIYALSITEPGGGTDIRGSLKTRAESLGGGIYRIVGEKIFTSNALYADYFLVLARAGDEASLFVCERSSRTIVEALELSGFRGSGVGRVIYHGAECQRLTEPGVDGVKEALKGINVGRLGYASIALGIAEGALDIIVSAASRKTIFGSRLLDYQGIRWGIASIEVKRAALESIIEVALSKGITPEIAAIAKVLGGDLAREASWLAVQVLGGRGLSMWSHAERLYRDSKVLDIGEGAREVLLDFISSRTIKRLLGQQREGPHSGS